MRAPCVIYFLLILHLFYGTSVKSHHNEVNNPLKKNILKIIYYGDENGINEVGENTEPLEYDIPCGLSNVSDLESDRIVGGETAKPYEFPWLVSIHELKDGEYVPNCGGAIIHPLFILSAAHCFDYKPIDIFLIWAGKFEQYTHEDHEQARSIVKVFDKYDFETYENDIALVKLNASFKFEPYLVGPICLPERNIELREKGVVAGWGRLEEKNNITGIELQKVTVDIISKDQGRKIYTKKGYDNYLHKCQLYTLTDDKDACQGDSGGPLMSLSKEDNKKVYINGIVSWGLGCARKGTPGVYAQVACFIKWIKKHIVTETED